MEVEYAGIKSKQVFSTVNRVLNRAVLGPCQLKEVQQIVILYSSVAVVALIDYSDGNALQWKYLGHSVNQFKTAYIFPADRGRL